MSAHCCHSDQDQDANDPSYRRVLIWVLILNAGMFFIESIVGWHGGSLALQADALDFFADATNYGVTLLVLGRALTWRSWAAIGKGLTMAGLGLWVFWQSVDRWQGGLAPDGITISAVAMLALAVNVSAAMMLFRHRGGDSNRRSIWLCSRNDALGNLAVMAAGLGVWGSQSNWPDLVVGLGIAALAVSSAFTIIRQAVAELRAAKISF